MTHKFVQFSFNGNTEWNWDKKFMGFSRFSLFLLKWKLMKLQIAATKSVSNKI